MTQQAGMFIPSEVATRLGVTKQTVLRWITEGEIAYVKVGSRYRIPASEVDRILTVQPARDSA